MIFRLTNLVVLIFLGASFLLSQELLVLSNNAENQILIVEPVSFRVVGALPSGVNPHDIAVSRDGRFAYVSNMGTPQSPGNTITVVNLKNRSIESTFDLGRYNGCHDVRVSRNGKFVWATCAPSKAVIEINSATGKVERDWKLDKDGAWMLVVTPDDKKIYTANLEGKSVSIIDRNTNLVKSIDFGASQVGIDVAPNGREVWVQHREQEKISIIDVAADRVIRAFPSGGKGFARVKFTPNGKYVLAAHNESNSLAVFEATTRRLVKNIPLSALPKVITISPDSKWAAITSPPGNKVLVIDLVNLYETRAVPIGKNPDGIAWARQAR